jgi:hypothetical protein
MQPDPDPSTSQQQRALQERYTTSDQRQHAVSAEAIHGLHQAVRDLSDVVSALTAYLLERSLQADGGNTAMGPENRDQLRGLQEAIVAIRARLPSEAD